MDNKRNKYNVVMSRVSNESGQSARTLKSRSYVTRHENVSSVRFGAKPTISNVSSCVYNELPLVLNDYVPEETKETIVKRSFVVKPKKTLRSLNPAKSPLVSKAKASAKQQNDKKSSRRCEMLLTSAPCLLDRHEYVRQCHPINNWSESHIKDCYSSRSHELKEEIKAFRDEEKNMKFRARLYRKCGVVVNDVLQVTSDKSVQSDQLDNINKDVPEIRCKLWINACRRSDLLDKSRDYLKNKYVCSLHFEKCFYGKTRLKKLAFPTLFLPGTDDIHPKYDAPTNTEEPKFKVFEGIAASSSQTPIHNIITSKKLKDNSSERGAKLSDRIFRKRKLISKSNRCNKILKQTSEKKVNEDITSEQFLKACDKFLTPKFSTIVKSQLNLKAHNKHNRYTIEFQLFCLNLYYSSPLAYRFLGKTICLPSKTTLANTYVPMSTKINQQMWEALTATVKRMSPSDRECIVCMDEMSLKCSLFYDSKQDKIVGLHEVNNEQRPYAARYAFTIMLRGIISNWKQPIGFSFISNSKIDDQLYTWIIDTVKKLFSLGFNVRAFVSDLASDFLQLSKLLGISKEKSDFDIDGRKLYYIFDVPHLIKCVRNNLLNNNFEFDNKLVKWDDIQNLYELDKTKDKRCAPRLTEVHLMPNAFQKQKVRFASQVFSNSVKAALETYVASGSLHVADGTIDFIAFMNDLFDLLNSSNVYSTKLFNKAYKGDDAQTELLNRARRIFNNLSIKNSSTDQDVTKTVKFLIPFLVTINSIYQLHSDMKFEHIDYLLTRRLNNDCLNNFFGIIRQTGGNCREPTCIQFMRAFRKSFLWQLMKISNDTNFTEDFDNILTKYKNFLKNKPMYATPAAVPNEMLPRVSPDYDLSEENAFLYICGYVFRKCVENHKCNTMIKYASSCDAQTTSKNLYIRRKGSITNKDSFGGLQIPPDNFLEYCQTLEQTLKATFTTFLVNNIGISLYQRLSEINFASKPCSCFPTELLIRTFLQIRIYYIIKFNNRNLRTHKSKCRKFQFPICMFSRN